MPIDFNPNPPLNNNIKPPVVNVEKNVPQKSLEDTFVKTVKINKKNDYDEIKISKKDFGKIKETGETAVLYTITNKNGASVDLSTYGATVTSIKVPDKNKKTIDVVQGYDSVTPYETAPVGHAGGTIGPCANKILGGEFSINEQKYQLECNKDDGKTHCHGGSKGFDLKNWKAKILKDGVEFSYLKKDMESGYPGNVKAKVTYKLDNHNNLHIQYHATTDKDTLLNMTNHTYFNLDGAENTSKNSVLNHVVCLPNSSKITENNQMAVPTGQFIDVENTPFDFRIPKKIKDTIQTENEQIKIGAGFDQNYCIDNYDGKTMQNIAYVKSEKTGIKLKVSTNLPGFQFYTSNHLGKIQQPNGKDGKRYEKRSALCIEPQFYPNAINTPEFLEKGILKASDEYNREIIYSFGE